MSEQQERGAFAKRIAELTREVRAQRKALVILLNALQERGTIAPPVTGWLEDALKQKGAD